MFVIYADIASPSLQYALSYPYISLLLGSSSKILRGWAYTYADPEQRTSYRPLKSALHLPETCRQIYNETATLAYRLNVFVLNSPIVEGESRGNLFSTSSAHMLAIRTIQLREYEVESLLRHLQVGDANVFTGLSGLRRLEIVRTKPKIRRQRIGILGQQPPVQQPPVEQRLRAYEEFKDLEIVWLAQAG